MKISYWIRSIVCCILFLFSHNSAYSTNKDPKNVQQPANNCTLITAGYEQSFEDPGIINPCWSTIVVTPNSISDIIVDDLVEFNVNQPWAGSMTYEVLPKTGNQFIRFKNNFDDVSDPPSDFFLVSPEIDDLDINKRVRFHLLSRRYGGGEYNGSTLQVGTMSDPTDPSSFNVIEIIDPSEMSEIKTDFRPISPWKEHTVYFDNYNGSDRYIAIKHGDELYNTEFYLDDFKYENTPDCPEPLYPVINSVSYDNASMTWEQYVNRPVQSWELSYGLEGIDPNSGTIVSSSNANFSFSGLLSETTYDVYVRASCASSSSEWSVKRTFTTDCFGFGVGYTESFENQSSGWVASCWTAITPTGTNTSYWDESFNYLAVPNEAEYANSGVQGVRMFNEVNHPFADATSDQIILVSPRLLDFNNLKKISFWINPEPSQFASPSEIVVGTLSNPRDYTTFTPFYIITDAAMNEDTWTQYEVDFSNYSLTDEYIGIKQNAINERQEIKFDDFEYLSISCAIPSDLAATQTGSGEITVAWSDNNPNNPSSWEIEYGEMGFALGSGTVVSVTTNPFVLSGLAPFIDYDFYVRAYCGASNGYSDWSEGYSFTMTCVETLPFYENFDSYDASMQHHPNGIPNFCWSISNHNHAGIGSTENFLISPSSAPNVGFVNWNETANDPLPGILASPFLPEFDNNKLLKFWIRTEVNGYGSGDNGVIVGTMSNPIDRSTFVPFETISGDEVPMYGREFVVDFSNYTGSDHHIAFMHENINDLHAVMIDDITIKTIPACLEPIHVKTTSISDTSASVSWEGAVANTSFDIEFGEAGFVLGSGSRDTTTSFSYTISGLLEESSYEYYVRSNCGNGLTSEWVGPIPFDTTCVTYELPWVENFDTLPAYGPGLLPECLLGQDHWVSSDVNLSDFQQGDGDTHFLYLTFDDYSLRQSLISPLFNLEAGTTYRFSFKVRKEDGDFSFQGFRIWSGQGNTQELFANLIHYYSDFDFGFSNFHTIDAIFTPVVTGDYSFKTVFTFSSTVSTITVDSFLLDAGYEQSIALSNGTPLLFNFESQIPSSILLEDTENSGAVQAFDNGNGVLRLTGGENDILWVESANPEGLWVDNQSFISKVNFELEVPAESNGLSMEFDLKQDYLLDPEGSLFRVLVNGNVEGSFAGNNSGVYETKSVDLSQFSGETVRVSLQHLGKYKGDSGIGDNAFVDNLKFQIGSLGISGVNEQMLSFSPSPVRDVLQVQSNYSIANLEIYNLIGQKMESREGIYSKRTTLDLTHLSTGIYFVTVLSEKGKNTFKIIKE